MSDLFYFTTKIYCLNILPIIVEKFYATIVNSYAFNGEAILTAGDGAGVGKVFHYANGKFNYHQRVYMISNFKKVVGRFLYYFIKEYFYHEVIRISAKSTVDSLRLPMLKEFNVSFPAMNHQLNIANFLDIKTSQFEAIISKKEQLIQKLEEAKKSLISEVVIGKVKIVDGELVKRKLEEMKDSGVEWLGMIPRDWDIKRIKYLLFESAERSINGKEEPLSMSQKFGLIKSSEMDRIPNQALSFKGNKICENGDLVFNKLKSHLGVFSVANQKGIVSPDYAVYRSKGTVNTKYLEFLFKTPTYINQFNRYSKGVGEGLTRLYTDDLFNIISLYPGIDHQFEIENVISERIKNMDVIIQKFTVQIQKLKQAKQSLISEAVTGKIDLRDWQMIEEGE